MILLELIGDFDEYAKNKSKDVEANGDAKVVPEVTVAE